MTVRTTSQPRRALRARRPPRSAAFYAEAFGFEVVAEVGDGAARVHARAPRPRTTTTSACSRSARRRPGPEQGRAGLYHLAWEVDTIQDLADDARRLLAAGRARRRERPRREQVAVRHDPDGIEFEVMWTVPREDWGDYEHEAVVQPLDLDAELARFG